MKVHLIKNYDGSFLPADQDTAEWAVKVKTGAVVYAEFKRERNYEFHKKYFGMINVAFQNQEKFTNEELFRKTMQVSAGYYDPVYFKGEEFRIPQSISFGSMSQENFEKLYSSVLDIILKHFAFGEEFEIELIRQFG